MVSIALRLVARYLPDPTIPMNLTAAQQLAVAAPGNVLVVAGAGSGKTRTLIERACACLRSGTPATALSELLLVTFTEAAAAEMRQRLRARLEEWAQQSGDSRWAEQVALFDTAHIGTLHSFCFRLVNQHFHQLALDPQLTVLPNAEARLLAEETLDAVLEDQFNTASPHAAAVQQLLQVQAAGRVRTLRHLVFRVHAYSRSLPNPEAWFRRQFAIFENSLPIAWQEWLPEAVALWQRLWRESLSRHAARGNDLARQCLARLDALSDRPTRAEIAAVANAVVDISSNPPRGKKGAWVNPLKQFWADAGFLASLASPVAPPNTDQNNTNLANPAPDPLAEDWEWSRSHVLTLLRLTRAFGEAFATAKRERGELDFADLEQFALRLLWDFERDCPTALAEEQRRRLRFVFVDEYQDINAAQDFIITALSRTGAAANRFLVGDMKQSIYRFRLADPRIFRGYAAAWRNGQPGRTIALAENFRSREAILDFVNSVFHVILRPEIGGLAYDTEAALQFGAPEQRRALSRAADTVPRVELHLRVKPKSVAADEADDELSDLREAEKEARLIAVRLKQLVEERHEIWDDAAREFRPVRYGDMAVLLRAPKAKAEGYAKQFERVGVPLQVARGGFFDSLEVSDLLNLLRLLDNPLQDLPTLAVLRSPLVGLTLDELATVRLALPKGHFWTALARWREIESTRSETAGQTHAEALFDKVSRFLTRYQRWRRLARQGSLSHCLDAVLAETHYADWLRTQTRGEQRRANVERLLTLAQQFDQFRRQGLFRFLRFIEAQQAVEAEPEFAPMADENAVRLMSIHQSKGLEFPVVVLGDLGKRFNDQDLRTDLILDEEYGLCPCIQPPDTGRKYPSLAHWLARRRQQRELLGEELRLLYVAMTRARDTLLLTGSVPESWLAQDPPVEQIGVVEILEGRSYLDWLWPWFATNGGPADTAPASGQHPLFAWTLHSDESLREESSNNASPAPVPAETPSTAARAVALWAQARELAAWQYGHRAATREPAKTSVTALRRRFMETEEAVDIFRPLRTKPKAKAAVPRRGTLPAAAAGTAHHRFLQRVALERTGSVTELQAEARRLETAGWLSPQEVAVLDFASLAAFWSSSVGRRIREHAEAVRRELGFTARFLPDEFRRVIGVASAPELAGEAVVVQGVADLVVVLPDELWLLDFKSDAIVAAELVERRQRYEPQVRLYALALERIFRRPVRERWLHFLALQQTVPVEVCPE